MSAVALLREQLAAILDVAPAGEGPLATGVRALDAALRGGIPRGRVTELVATPGGGAATLVRRLAETTVARDEGLWIAVIDATRTLAPRDWASICLRPGVWVIRPADPARAAWCADVLLRSGAFALVVLDGAPPASRAVAVRLERLAREHDTALVIVRDAGQAAGALPSTLRMRVGAAGRQDRVAVQVDRGAPPRRVELPRTIQAPRRLGRHPEPPDRRGAERTTRAAGRRR